MQPNPSNQRHPSRLRFLPVAAIALTLLVLAAVVIWARQDLRGKIRAQIAARDGEVLQAVTLMQQFSDETGAHRSIESPAEQFAVMLESSRLLNLIVAARLFTPDGRFIAAVPANVSETILAPADISALGNLKPVSHFRKRVALSDLFLPVENSLTNQDTPILEVNIPLYEKDHRKLAGVAQFLLNGQSMANEFDALERNLTRQSIVTFLAAGGIVSLLLGWSFRHLQQTNHLLEARTANLVRANHELALAAKSSAVGAVTAHLLHGLQNPLFGLQNFVSTRVSQGGETSEWQAAMASTRRMQTLIGDVVTVLRESGETAGYEMTVAELAEVIALKMNPSSLETGVKFVVRNRAEATFDNRTANLITLVLCNLLQNAMEATPRGRSVELLIGPSAEGLAFAVCDQGCGLPAGLRDHLFAPCQSSKENGSGIGLAICKQLANHLEARLELKRSDENGTTFELHIPERLFLRPKENLASQRV